jgi:DNA mismatch repair ATPase MutS
VTLKDPFHAISLLDEEKTLTPAEIFVLAHLALSANRVRAVISATPINWPARVVPPSLTAVEKRLLPGSSGEPLFYVADSYSAELGRTRAERKARERAWRAEMTKEAIAAERLLGRRPGLREEVAIRKTNQEAIEKARLMPELGETRETLTHVHFRLKATEEAVKLEREINRLRQKETILEEEVLARLSRELRERRAELEKAAWALAELDYLLRKVELAAEWHATEPEVVEGPAYLMLDNAFHPTVRREVEMRGGAYQPISLEMDSPVAVITGPNMGGKTISLATAGLCVALAQWGFLVPCGRMRFSLYDYVYFQPETYGKPGLSSFASEVLSLKEALSRREEKGLILLDEVGRGTNPAQGLALYAAILDYLRETRESRATVIASTHFHGLAKALDVPHWQVAGLVPDAGAIDAGSIGKDVPKDINWLYKHMDYRLQRVGPDTPTPQDALLVARVLGLNGEIVTRAEAFVNKSKESGGLP